MNTNDPTTEPETPAAGQYADSRTYALGQGWKPVAQPTLDLALEQTRAALAPEDAVKRLATYYDPAGGYSGPTFLDVEPNHPHSVAAADLWAVSTLSVKIDVRQGRRLLQDPHVRGQVNRQLASFPASLPITDLEPPGKPDYRRRSTLDVMWDLHDCLRTLMSEEIPATNRWVFAAKLCARKRPLLFPVRDELVCSYLAGGAKLRRGEGQLGQFQTDTQVYAYLMTDQQVRDDLDTLWRKATADGLVVDDPHLRLLDVALWTQARWR